MVFEGQVAKNTVIYSVFVFFFLPTSKNTGIYDVFIHTVT